MPDLPHVRIDYSLCLGHGRCHVKAPEAFGEDDEGRGVVQTDALPTVPRPLLERAASLCPANAITVDGG